MRIKYILCKVLQSHSYKSISFFKKKTLKKKNILHAVLLCLTTPPADYKFFLSEGAVAVSLTGSLRRGCFSLLLLCSACFQCVCEPWLQCMFDVWSACFGTVSRPSLDRAPESLKGSQKGRGTWRITAKSKKQCLWKLQSPPGQKT